MNWMKKIIVGVLLCTLTLSGIECDLWAAQNIVKVQADSEVQQTMNDIYVDTLKEYPDPDFSCTWKVIGIQRSTIGASSSYQQKYYKNIYNYCKKKNWKLTSTTYTDYDKVILGLTSIGINASNVGGHNLFDALADMKNVKKQGINGVIWTLMALNAHPDYNIPKKSGVSEQTTEEKLIQTILDRQLKDGGWSMSGERSDTDLTAMAMQSLTPYYGKREDVTKALDQAIFRLSNLQTSTGGYASYNTETSESCAQVIVALSGLGIDSKKDARFMKNGTSVFTRLMDYYVDHGFAHVLPANGKTAKKNSMATEQGMYAFASYQRMKLGKTSLYDMSDMKLVKGKKEESTTATTEHKTTANKTTAKTTAQKNGLSTVYPSTTEKPSVIRKSQTKQTVKHTMTTAATSAGSRTNHTTATSAASTAESQTKGDQTTAVGEEDKRDWSFEGNDYVQDEASYMTSDQAYAGATGVAAQQKMQPTHTRKDCKRVILWSSILMVIVGIFHTLWTYGVVQKAGRRIGVQKNAGKKKK